MHEGCEIRNGLDKDLGYSRIFIAGKDVLATEKKGDAEGKVFICTETEANLIGVIRNAPKAIIFKDMKINKKAIEQMKEYGILLCIPISSITSLYGLQRSRALYLTRKLAVYARNMRVDVSIVTMAKEKTNMCSRIQLMEMAKLIGLKEEYAKESLSRVNRSLVEA